MWYIALIILIKVLSIFKFDSTGIVILLLNTPEVFVIVSLSLEKKICQKKKSRRSPKGLILPR